MERVPSFQINKKYVYANTHFKMKNIKYVLEICLCQIKNHLYHISSAHYLICVLFKVMYIVKTFQGS